MKPKSKKVSRLKKCPARLESLLNALRMVPPSQHLRPFHKALPLITRESTDDPRFTPDVKALEYCLQELKESATAVSNFVQYVWGPRGSQPRDPVEAIEDAVYRYEDFRMARERITFLAQISERVAKSQRTRQLIRSLDIEIDEQGKLWPSENWFQQAVKGVEASRVRECHVCNQIFWAGRKSVQGCSPRCLDILRKRKKRKLDAEKNARNNKQRTGRLTETERRDLVRRALESDELTQPQIVEKTKLTADEVADVLGHLILESGEVSSEERDETRIYFLNTEFKRPVKSQKKGRKRR